MPDLKDKIADLGEGRVNLADLGANVLAHDKVLYKGHAVAAVAAANPHVAEEAVKLIEVEYEPLPAVTWVLDAMKHDAPLLHDHIHTDATRAANRRQPSNVAKYFCSSRRATSTRASPRPTWLSSTNSAPPRCIKATSSRTCPRRLWNQDGHLTIWTATQGSFTARQQTAELLQIPISQVTVVPCEIGGGFGGKIAVYLEPVRRC